MAPTRPQLVLALSVLALGAGVGWFVVKPRHKDAPPPDLVETVDTRQALDRVLAERAAHAPPPDQLPPVRDARLRREPMDVETARLFYPPAGMNRPYNEHFFAAQEPNVSKWVVFSEHEGGGFTMRTNSLGMMEDADVLPVKPDLRVLVSGDSHGAGMCANAESFTNQLEARLAESHPGRSVEALNASAGGYNPYNYLGVLEDYVRLDPDVFIMCIYGGNDYGPMLQLERYYDRRPPCVPSGWSLELYRSLKPRNIASQELSQAQYFLKNPDDFDVAVETVDAIVLEAERICREHDIAFILMYIPTPLTTQARFFKQDMAFSFKQSGLDEKDLGISDRITNRWMARAEKRGVDLVDLRPLFRDAPELLYNHVDDCHINLKAHAMLGSLLAEHVEAAIAQRAKH